MCVIFNNSVNKTIMLTLILGFEVLVMIIISIKEIFVMPAIIFIYVSLIYVGNITRRIFVRDGNIIIIKIKYNNISLLQKTIENLRKAVIFVCTQGNREFFNRAS